MKIRIPVLPIIIHDGKITFNTVTLTLPVNDLGEKIIYPKDDVDNIAYKAESSDPVSIYLDPSCEPKFGKDALGGWCSPPPEKLKYFHENDIDCGPSTIINCKCQKSDTLTLEDVQSLEFCGHSLACKYSTPRPSASSPVPVAPAAPNAYPAPIAAPEPPRPDKADFCPPNGIPVRQLPSVIAFLEGTEEDVITAVKNSGWTENFDVGVVLQELAKFYNFTRCNGCGLFMPVENLANPRCLGCAGTSGKHIEED